MPYAKSPGPRRSERRPTPWIFGGLAVWLACLVAVGVAACSSNNDASDTIELNPAFSEPVKLSSDDGILELNLTAAQSTARLNTVAQPVSNMLLFKYELLRGSASDGRTSGENMYPAPTLAVNPGDTLILHVANELGGLKIEDYADPVLTPVGTRVPLTPKPVTDIPLNIHTHGLHVSPNGNADNVLLEIPTGLSNTYEYDIPANHPQGLYWYHPHRHMLTESQVYRGLAGLLTVGRPEGAIAKVSDSNLPVRTMALQDNFVANRAGGQSQLNAPGWTQLVNTAVPPKPGALEAGTYRPLLAPTNFTQAQAGTTFKTNWFAGKLSADNKRGLFQFMPQNLMSFKARGESSPVDRELPDELRDVQFTVNGAFQPAIESRPGQTEIWALGNISSQAYMNIAVRSTATGKLIPLRVLSRDGNPEPIVGTGMANDGTTYLLPPASRVALAVTMPLTGDLQLELPPVSGPNAKHTQETTTPGILYTNTGDGNPMGRVGTISVDPADVSWFDGFKTFPTQVLATASPTGDPTSSVDFALGEPLKNDQAPEGLTSAKADVTRSFEIGGGSSPHVNPADPNGFMYQFQGTTWPTTPVIHPRLGSVEDWRFINRNNDQHPIHVHVNDFQVMSLVDPVAGTKSGPQPFGYDNYNVPAPLLGANDKPTTPGTMTIRSKFRDYTGTFVTHCHRLDHEDNGLMMTINVIPAVSTYAVAKQGSATQPGSVEVRDQNGNAVLAKVVPFPYSSALPSVAMADVDGDQILDLLVGAGPDESPEVVAYSGAGDEPFSKEIVRFMAFDTNQTGGVAVSAAVISGSPLASNIIAASGPGQPNTVKVYANDNLAGTNAPQTIAQFEPFSGEQGVSLTAGLVDPMGRASIITAPKSGPATIKVFKFDLLEPSSDSTAPNSNGHQHGQEVQPHADSGALGSPSLVTEFAAFGSRYTGGVSLATGWLAGNEGGAESIVVGQKAGDGVVRAFSSGSNLTGQSAMYVEDFAHQMEVSFSPSMSFTPFGTGVSVATTSTTHGAKLIVSGKGGTGGAGHVRTYDFVRSPTHPTTLAPIDLGLVSGLGSGNAAVGGD